jgi:hypothetical protein
MEAVYSKTNPTTVPVMPFATYGKVVRCLRDDLQAPTDQQRREACGLFTQWKQACDKALAKARGK